MGKRLLVGGLIDWVMLVVAMNYAMRNMAELSSLRPFSLGAKQSAHYLDVAFEASLGAVVAHQ